MIDARLFEALSIAAVSTVTAVGAGLFLALLVMSAG
jgi:hypothetical protein